MLLMDAGDCGLEIPGETCGFYLLCFLPHASATQGTGDHCSVEQQVDGWARGDGKRHQDS